MKRVALLTVFFHACTFAASFQAQAAVISKLSRINVGQIGDKIKTVTSSNDVLLPTTMAFRSESKYEAAANLLTIPIYAYNPALGVAASTVIGFAFDSKMDVKDAYDKKLLQGQAAINDIINGTFPPSAGPVSSSHIEDPTGSIWTDGSGHTYKIGGTSSYWNGNSATKTMPVCLSSIYNAGPKVSLGNGGFMTLGTTASGVLTLWKVEYSGIVGQYYLKWWYPTVGISTSDPVSYPETSPSTLTQEQASRLTQDIADASATNPAVKDEIDTVIKSNPDTITNAPQITQQDVDNFITTNNYNTSQTYIDYLTNLSNEYPDDTSIKIALEQAKAEQAKEDAETYAPITDSAFEEPYNPGEFDIPARFTTFLNNVKASGLFSFSNDFFNSLPGGGSPVYEIEAGRYGHHSIDLSVTLSAGLAILKTILLACFGFLSIRAVIMKR